MIWTQRAITEWATRTFGKPTTPGNLLSRASEEMEEALLGYYDGVSGQDLAEEMADIYIVISQVCEALGYDLLDEVHNKMEINVKRKWKLHGDGTGQHE